MSLRGQNLMDLRFCLTSKPNENSRKAPVQINNPNKNSLKAFWLLKRNETIR